MKGLPKFFLALIIATCISVSNLHAGSIFVSNDEWLWSSGELSRDSDQQLAQNVAAWLTGGTGNILILSNDFGLNGALPTYLRSLGYDVTVSGTSVASLSGYQAVYVASDSPYVSDAMLASYVMSGGNVLLEAGTGCCGGAAGEAALWNPFLNQFGLGLVPSYNPLVGDISLPPFYTQAPYGPALFTGVNSVFIYNGNNVLNLGTESGVQVFYDSSGEGLYAAWTSAGSSTVPEPSSLLLLGSGLTSLSLFVRRRRLGRVPS